MRRLLDEPGLRRGELNPERAGVQRPDADPIAEGGTILRALVVLLRADDSEELVGVVGAELGRERPLPRVREVLGRDEVSVRPAAVRPEMERDRPAVPAEIPASARLGTGSRSRPSFTSGSMMFRRMLLDVVSVARPGSSDGGSVPQLTVISCFAARPPAPSSPPPQAVSATRSARATAQVDISFRDPIAIEGSRSLLAWCGSSAKILIDPEPEARRVNKGRTMC